MVPVSSSYYGIDTATFVAAGGRKVVYLRRRFVPDRTNAVVLAEHVVVQGDRLDNVTARYLGDPEQFWRLCDANNAMQPQELTADSRIGRIIRVPLPQGGQTDMPDPSIRLQLFLGPTVPVPAPFGVVDALISLEVTNKDQDRDGFQMAFSLGKDTLLDYSLLSSGIFDPPSRVIIMVTIGVLPQVLIDGIITTHQVVPSNEPGKSTLHVTGEDITLKLDLEEKSETFPNQPDFLIVTRLLASYATLGLVPQFTPTTAVPIQLYRIPPQQATALPYLRQLARNNG